jgi:hypothetical protein
MTQWVVFIPRSESVANTKDVDQNPSLVGQATAWISESNKKLVEQRILRIGDKLAVDVLSAPGTTLYIMGGHGKEGRNYLTWPGESNPLCCHQLGDALQAAGLPKTYGGKIKVYSCLSADNKGSAVAFAKLFAQYMAYLEYRACSVWGYTGAVSKGYVNSGTATEPLGKVKTLQFKEPTELGKGYHRYATVTGGYGFRAKAARREFTEKNSTVTIAHCNVCNRF